MIKIKFSQLFECFSTIVVCEFVRVFLNCLGIFKGCRFKLKFNVSTRWFSLEIIKLHRVFNYLWFLVGNNHSTLKRADRKEEISLLLCINNARDTGRSYLLNFFLRTLWCSTWLNIFGCTYLNCDTPNPAHKLWSELREYLDSRREEEGEIWARGGGRVLSKRRKERSKQDYHIYSLFVLRKIWIQFSFEN